MRTLLLILMPAIVLGQATLPDLPLEFGVSGDKTTCIVRVVDVDRNIKVECAGSPKFTMSSTAIHIVAELAFTTGKTTDGAKTILKIESIEGQKVVTKHHGYLLPYAGSRRWVVELE